MYRTRKQIIEHLSKTRTSHTPRSYEDAKVRITDALRTRKLNIKQISYLLDLNTRFPKEFTLPVVNTILSHKTYSKRTDIARWIWDNQGSTFKPLKSRFSKNQIAAFIAWVKLNK